MRYCQYKLILFLYLAIVSPQNISFDIYIYIYVCVCVLLPSKQNQRGGDVTGWKGGLQNECQFIEARPHSHTQNVLRNLEWREWKSTYTKYQRLTMDKLQWCYFCLMPDINKNKLFFLFQINIPNKQTHTHTLLYRT